MSVAKVIELNASSTVSMEDAVKHGLKKAAETMKGIKGAWVNEIKVGHRRRRQHHRMAGQSAHHLRGPDDRLADVVFGDCVRHRAAPSTPRSPAACAAPAG